MSEFIHTSNNDDLAYIHVDNVHPSRRVFDDESSEWICYTSSTDALIAKLHLEAHIPSPYINAFLSVLSNPHFNLKELSFQRCADIDRSVATYRRTQALERASASGSMGVVHPARARLPFDILALVIESITSERLPLQTNDPSSIFGRHTHPDQRIASRLKSLALTHRTLTPLAQRSLGQRLIVQNARDLRALMRSPLLGPWTTELLLNLHFPSGFGSGPAGFGYGAAAATTGTGLVGGGGTRGSGFAGLEDIIQRASEILQNPLLKELRFLRIRTPAYLEQGSTEYLIRLLNVIGENFSEKLETLWWIAPKNASRYARVDLEDILRETRRMRNLKKLIVQNVQCGWVDYFGRIDMEEEGNSMRTQLEELSFVDLLCPAGPLEGTCLWWLLNSSNSLTLKSLTLRLNTSTDALGSLLASSPSLLARLDTLSLKLTQPPDGSFFSRIFHSSSSSDSLSTAHASLRTLHLCTETAHENTRPFLSSSTLSQIPSTVRTLHLELSHLARLRKSSWSAQQDELVRFVLLHDSIEDEGNATGGSTEMMGRGELEELEITAPITRSDRSFTWDQIEETCKAKGVKFVLKKEIL